MESIPSASQTESRAKGPSYSQRRIGLLADWFDEHYQQVILRTLEEGVTQRGSSLVAFAGGIPGSTKRNSEERHRVFDLVSPASVDGAILLAGTMVNELGVEALQGLTARLAGVPMCSIGVELPGIPSILINNQAGVEQAMHHLVEKHSARRIGFICGPEKNKEAGSRFDAYRTALQNLGLEYDANYVQPGDFLRRSGETAVGDWLAKGILPEAILCANDEMALGAMAALSRAGKSVPSDVVIIGFDDLESARLTTPPLTTVRQPLKDLAIAAVRTIMDQIMGRDVPRIQVLETQLIVRESCGCRSLLGSTGQSIVPEQPRKESKLNFAESFAHKRQSLRVELARAGRGEFPGGAHWEDRLITTFADSSVSQSADFVVELQRLFSAISNVGGDTSRLQDVISAFRRVAIPCCDNEPELRDRIEDLLQEARLLAAHAAERAEAAKRLSLERFTRTLVDVGAALMSTYDLSKLCNAVYAELPRVGITTCFLSVYDKERVSGSDAEQARLISAYDGDRKLTLSAAPFASQELVPKELWPSGRPYHLQMLPLFLNGQSLGFALVESRNQSTILELVRGQLSIALYGALLAQTKS